MNPTAALFVLLRKDSASVPDSTLLDPEVIETAERLDVLPYLAYEAHARGIVPVLSPEVVDVVFGSREGTWSSEAVLAKVLANQQIRLAALRELHRRATEILDAAGLASLPLKGMALLEAGVWAVPEARTIRDVDLFMLDEGDAARAQDVLLAGGFEPVPGHWSRPEWEDDHEEKPLRVDGIDGALEVHGHALVRAYRGLLPRPTLTRKPSDLVRHAILHAQLQDEAYRSWRLPLTSLLDVAFLLDKHPECEPAVAHPGDPRRVSRVIRFHLYAARRLRDGPGSRSLSLSKGAPLGSRSGTPGMSVRWNIGGWLAGHPRAQGLLYDVAIAPVALSRDVMERRAGHPLRFGELFARRVGFLLARGRRSVAQLARGDH